MAPAWVSGGFGDSELLHCSLYAERRLAFKRISIEMRFIKLRLISTKSLSINLSRVRLRGGSTGPWGSLSGPTCEAHGPSGLNGAPVLSIHWHGPRGMQSVPKSRATGSEDPSRKSQPHPLSPASAGRVP